MWFIGAVTCLFVKFSSEYNWDVFDYSFDQK